MISAAFKEPPCPPNRRADAPLIDLEPKSAPNPSAKTFAACRYLQQYQSFNHKRGEFQKKSKMPCTFW
jgi:hypothetical protein